MKKISKGILSALFISGIFFSSCSSTAILNMIDQAADLDSTASSVKRSVNSIKKASEEITPEDEYILGRTVASVILKDNNLYTSTRKTKYVNNICYAIVLNSEKPDLFNGYKVAILDSPDLNAISTPGGHIFISKGLLDLCDSEDTLAAVIAHEIAHIQLGHSTKVIKSSRVAQAIVDSADAIDRLTRDEPKSELEEEISVAASDFVLKLAEEGYSKDQEFEADEYAIKLLADAGYSPAAMKTVLELLKTKQNGNTTLDKTHPSPDKRIKKVKSVLAKAPYVDNKSDPNDRMARFKQNTK